jgi:hypothetical protein
MRAAGAVALGFLLMHATETAARSDSCTAQLPSSLVAAIPKTYPGYRAPLESDNEAEDVAYNKAHRGNGCLGVAIGDFDGRDATQYLLALTSTNGRSGLVVIARLSHNGWTFRQLQRWRDLRNRLFVERVDPGRYVRTEALSDPVKGDERQTMTCRHSGVGFGETESSEVVYCSFGNAWRYVQTSD